PATGALLGARLLDAPWLAGAWLLACGAWPSVGDGGDGLGDGAWFAALCGAVFNARLASDDAGRAGTVAAGGTGAGACSGAAGGGGGADGVVTAADGPAGAAARWSRSVDPAPARSLLNLVTEPRVATSPSSLSLSSLGIGSGLRTSI